jgi:putative oxidoreductase
MSAPGLRPGGYNRYVAGEVISLTAGQQRVMTVVRALARPMMASIFVIQGFDTLRHPEKVAARAEPVVRPLADRFTAVPAKTEDAVRLNGAVQMVAGTLLALGRFPRLSALALAATLVPTTAAGHRFWEAEEDADRNQQRIHFLKNLSMFGGLLVAAADTGGRPSLAWRAQHGARTARREASLVTRTAKASGKAGRRVGQLTG